MWAEGQECRVQTDAQRKALGLEPEDTAFVLGETLT